MSDPVSWDTIENALRAWVLSASGFADDHVVWAQQGMPRPSDPWISLNIQSINEVGIDWTDWENNPFSFTDKTVSAVVGNSLTLTAHGLHTGDGPIRLTNTGGALPGGLFVLTDYWIIRIDADHIQLAASFTDSVHPGDLSTPIPITLTDAGTGTQKVVSTGNTEINGQEMVAKTRGQWVGTLSIQCFALSATGTADAMSVVSKVRMKARTGPVIQALNTAGIGVSDFTPVKSIGQAISSTIFEPRAVTTMTFFLAAEVEDFASYIARVRGSATTPLISLDSGRRPES